MEYRKKANRKRLWFELAQLVIALFVPLTIIVYTIMQNNTEISIAQQNRLQDLKIADERREQDILLSNDEQEEATLVRYFDSLGKLLEKNEKLVNQTNIARFKTLTALAQLKSKRKGFLIRSLIENNLIITTNGKDSILDLSLADLTGLDLTNNMLVDNEMQCVILSETTLTNSSFRGMKLHGVKFVESILINSDFSSSHTDLMWSCGDGIWFGVDFRDAVLDNCIFDDVKYEKSIFSGTSLNGARMRRFKCTDCDFYKANMTSMDLSGAEFISVSIRMSIFQRVNMSCTLLYKANFTYPDFRQSILTMVNATETIFNTSRFDLASLNNNSFVRTIIYNSSFDAAHLKGSSWYEVKISYTSFVGADMTYVNFINSQCHYCVFNQTQLIGANFTNSSLDGSDFRRTNVTYEQLIVARSLHDVILPDGTIFQSIKKENL
jgi:uncharacterized protein YjbI with pentapeptide repeats